MIWSETSNATNASMTPIVNSTEHEASDSKLPFLLKLIDQIIEFKSGIYIRKPDKNRVVQGYDEVMKTLVSLLQRLMDSSVFAGLSSDTRILLLHVFTAAWKVLPENTKFSSQLSPLLPAILSLDPTESLNDAEGGDITVNPATILSQDLLPYLSPDSGVTLVGQAILAVAAKQASRDRTRALMLLFSVASIRRSEDVIDDDDAIFFTENASLCNISSADKNSLTDLCLDDARTCCTDTASIAELGVAVRCLPFLVLAGVSDEDSDHECTTLLK